MSRRKIRRQGGAKERSKKPIGVREALERDLYQKRMESKMVLYSNLVAMLDRGVLDLDRIGELDYARDIADWLDEPIGRVQKGLRRLKDEQLRRM